MCRIAVARGLDRLNVALVSWRLAQDSTCGPRAAAAGAPARRTPAPIGASPRLVGRRRGKELWGREGSDWLASRLPCATEASSRAVIVLHGWLATPVQLAYYGWLARPLTRSADVWLPRLPAHVERTPPGAVSGSRCLSPDPACTARALSAAVAETRWLARWLQDSGKEVSIWGVSLGGWVAALAAREPVCERLVLWAPVVDPVETLEWSPLGRILAERSTLHERDASLETTLHELAAGRHDLALPGSRVLVVGGRHDNVVRRESLVAAARRWSARVELLDHGHISLLLSRRARQATLEALAASIRSRS